MVLLISHGVDVQAVRSVLLKACSNGKRFQGGGPWQPCSRVFMFQARWVTRQSRGDVGLILSALAHDPWGNINLRDIQDIGLCTKKHMRSPVHSQVFSNRKFCCYLSGWLIHPLLPRGYAGHLHMS